MKTLLGVFLCSCALLARHNEIVDESANAKIRKEAADYSQVMFTLHQPGTGSRAPLPTPARSMNP